MVRTIEEARSEIMKISKRIVTSLFILLILSVYPATGFCNQTTVTWHGHAAVEIVSPSGTVLMVDPWLRNPSNPAAAGGNDPLADVTKLDYIFFFNFGISTFHNIKR